MTLPQIPECDVTRDENGVYHLTHVDSGGSATATTEREAHLAGLRLRILSNVTETPFRTGDPA